MKSILNLLSLSILLGASASLSPTYAFSPKPTPVDQVPSNICDSQFRTIQNSNGTDLWLYSTPSYNASGHPQHNASAVIDVLEDGTKVLFNIGDATGEWSEITIPGGTTGWVPTIALANSSVGSDHFNGNMRVHTLDGGTVNLRTEPWLDSRVIRPLQTGEVVRPHNFEGYWSEVSTTDGLRGFVASEYLVCD